MGVRLPFVVVNKVTGEDEFEDVEEVVLFAAATKWGSASVLELIG